MSETRTAGATPLDPDEAEGLIPTHVTTREELNRLDEQVNKFIAANGIRKVISVSDACTTDNTGATIGIIRILTYE